MNFRALLGVPAVSSDNVTLVFPLQNMWIERTIYVTAYKLPGILRWFEVKSVFMVRSAWLYWDCVKKKWGFIQPGGICVSQCLVLWTRNPWDCPWHMLREPAECSLRVTQAMLFIPSPPRPSALLESTCVSQQVPRKNRELRWCRETLLHARESGLNLIKENLDALIAINSKYPNNQRHCMPAFLTTCG